MKHNYQNNLILNDKNNNKKIRLSKGEIIKKKTQTQNTIIVNTILKKKHSYTL
jgi:hypothetical protein